MQSATILRTPREVAAAHLDPKWNKARELLLDGRRVAEEFAQELERLRNQYLRQGQGRRTDLADDGDQESGFQAAVERELGISKATAYRYIAAIKALEICTQIANAPRGEVIELPGAGSYAITPEVREKARAMREAIVVGDVPLNRAMPAVAGMFQVAGGGTGGKAATNHGANVWAGLQKLHTSLSARHWRKGELSATRSWDAAANSWTLLLEQLPDELKRETLDWAKKQGGRK